MLPLLLWMSILHAIGADALARIQTLGVEGGVDASLNGTSSTAATSSMVATSTVASSSSSATGTASADSGDDDGQDQDAASTTPRPTHSWNWNYPPLLSHLPTPLPLLSNPNATAASDSDFYYSIFPAARRALLHTDSALRNLFTLLPATAVLSESAITTAAPTESTASSPLFGITRYQRLDSGASVSTSAAASGFDIISSASATASLAASAGFAGASPSATQIDRVGAKVTETTTMFLLLFSRLQVQAVSLRAYLLWQQ
ncbi:hypothetical protein D9757_003768 [Collybiopsis confluens]|uniref:Uncharacterized protein n=1 Tax=Collybiopsis confluens TaxID=2823264 RepID=A0A8H5HV46_9AGAR|nr:hypothetical protein D9757_003768 [Collybiopsis confluens]